MLYTFLKMVVHYAKLRTALKYKMGFILPLTPHKPHTSEVLLLLLLLLL